MSTRHRARRLTLQCLCCLDVQGQHALQLIDRFASESRESPETISAARRLFEATRADLDQCDRLLARHTRHWDLTRLALVDRNILRLAAHELLSGSAPPKVVISESLSLAREFSMAESPRFINGVLDAMAKEVYGEIGGHAAEPSAESEDPEG